MPRDPNTRHIRPLTSQEALDRHLALVGYDRLGLGLNKPQEHYVYHYTNLAGLRGILDTRSVWASDYRFLNDQSELTFGLEILEMSVASNHGIGSHIPSELRTDILTAIALMLENNSGTYVLSASFCKKGNLLSQWRAYGGQDGIAVAFDRKFIESRAVDQSFLTGSVHYYFSEGKEDLGSDLPLTDWIMRRVDTLTTDLASIPASVRAELNSDEAKLAENLIHGRRRAMIDTWIALTASFIKHPAFREESEWRCVMVSSKSEVPNGKEIHDRPSGTRVIPYVNFSLGAETATDLGIRHVVIGPSTNAEAIDHSIAHIFFARGVSGASTMTPFNPLRV